jgi:hypothetical protein
MTTYCEGAAAAEVLFSLTGGREGRIVSSNPPIEVSLGSGYIYALEILLEYPRPDLGRLAITSTIFEKFFLETIDEIFQTREYNLFFNDTGGIRYFEIRKGAYNLNQVVYSVSSVYLDSLGYLDISLTRRPQYGMKNAFVISDNSGILYFQEYPEGVTPTYEVNCKSCPEGLCAIRRYDEIVCIDCKKVIGGINNASQKLDSIYG